MNDSGGLSDRSNRVDSGNLRELDKQHLWHPFTQMQDWIASGDDPLIISSGRGAVLVDSEGKEYLDGNSSIWTNIHGHGHAVINRAIQEQLEKIAHCSALGFSNEPAIQLGKKLVDFFPAESLTKVFYSDSGSTAIECACKMAVQFRQLRGQEEKSRFVSFSGAYHGDTVGAASLGGIGAFFDRFSSAGYEVERLENTNGLRSVDPGSINALIVEPLIQGAAGMKTWPSGMLKELRSWCDANDVFLILDEVMTGFGRTGKMFACQHEDVVPDFLCLAKGLTGGYLPLAATLTTDRVFDAFLGTYEEMKTFFYGHSYCANPLGCAAALGSLQVFEEEEVLAKLPGKIKSFADSLQSAFNDHPRVGEVRQVGLIAGIDLTGCDWKEQIGAKVSKAARKYGLLTRAVRDTLTLMPPLCSSDEQIREMTKALRRALDQVLPD